VAACCIGRHHQRIVNGQLMVHGGVAVEASDLVRDDGRTPAVAFFEDLEEVVAPSSGSKPQSSKI
jgi:hypothetical protein